MVYLYIILTVVFWASAFVGIRHAVFAYHPFELALFRYIVASLTLLVFMVVRRIQAPQPKDMIRFFVTGIIGIFIYNFALNYGELTTTAGEACFIVNTSPLFTTLMGACFLEEEIGYVFISGLIISFLGVSLIAFSFSNGISFKTGSLYIFIASIAHALYFILQKPLLTKYEPIEVTCYCLWSGTIAMIPLGYGFFKKISHVAPEYTFSVIYLGIFPAAIAYLCWAAVLKRMDASRAASFLYMVPAIAILIGWAWLNELPSAVSIFGGMVAIAGVVFANRQKKEKAIKLET